MRGQQASLATCTYAYVACSTSMSPCRHAAGPWLQQLRGLSSLSQLELLDASSRDIVGQLAPLSVLSQLTCVSLGLMATQEQPVGVLAMLFQCVPQLQSLRCCNPLETVSELKCLEVGMSCHVGLPYPSTADVTQLWRRLSFTLSSAVVAHQAALIMINCWATCRRPAT